MEEFWSIAALEVGNMRQNSGPQSAEKHAKEIRRRTDLQLPAGKAQSSQIHVHLICADCGANARSGDAIFDFARHRAAIHSGDSLVFGLGS